jgi:V/A-type H+-transporting ATPase subunit E
MAGIDEILGIISSNQKQTESSMIRTAQQQADAIIMKGSEDAKAAYEQRFRRASEQAQQDFKTACSSFDAQMKRRILAEKLDIISEITERTLARLNALPAKDYFGLLIKMAEKKLRAGEGTISLGEADLKRIPADFEQSLKTAAEKVGGTVTLSSTPADIEDGFILTYGLISENCSFRAIIEAEKDGIRDTAAQALFGAGD